MKENINKILNSKQLTGNEKLILIYILNNNSNNISLKNLDIANNCNISVTSVSNSINHLYKINILYLKSYDGRDRNLQINLQYL